MFTANFGTLIALGVMIAIFASLNFQDFLTVSNFSNILAQVSLTAIVSMGLTMAMIMGEFDLSVGYNASFSGVLVAGLLVEQHLPLVVAVLGTVAVGAVIGLVNGLLVTKAGINAIIATLGVGTVLVGLSYGYSNGVPFASGLPSVFLRLTSGTLLGVPNLTVVMVVVGVVLWLVVNRTVLGENMRAVGGNAEAARLAGVGIDQVKISAFVICAIAAAITGILLSSVVGSGTIGAGDSYLLSAFACVYLGSATLRDGEFHIVGTIIGAIIIGVGFNGLSIIGAPTFYQYIFTGAILILAIGFSSVARRYAVK